MKAPKAGLWTKKIEVDSLIDLDRVILKGDAPSKDKIKKIREAIPCTVFLNNRKLVEVQRKMELN